MHKNKKAETQLPVSKERPRQSILGALPLQPCFAAVILFSWLCAGISQLSPDTMRPSESLISKPQTVNPRRRFRGESRELLK